MASSSHLDTVPSAATGHGSVGDRRSKRSVARSGPSSRTTCRPGLGRRGSRRSDRVGGAPPRRPVGADDGFEGRAAAAADGQARLVRRPEERGHRGGHGHGQGGGPVAGGPGRDQVGRGGVGIGLQGRGERWHRGGGRRRGGRRGECGAGRPRAGGQRAGGQHRPAAKPPSRQPWPLSPCVNPIMPARTLGNVGGHLSRVPDLVRPARAVPEAPFVPAGRVGKPSGGHARRRRQRRRGRGRVRSPGRRGEPRLAGRAPTASSTNPSASATSRSRNSARVCRPATSTCTVARPSRRWTGP